MDITLYFAAMWLSEVAYSKMRERDNSATKAYFRARGTVMFDRVITGRLPVVRDIESNPQLHLVRK